MSSSSIDLNALCLERVALRIGRAPSRRGGGTTDRLSLHYQGRLLVDGNAVNGLFDIGLLLHGDPITTEAIGSPVTKRQMMVRDGLFSLVADFELGGSATRGLWLAIGLRTSEGPRDVLRVFPREPLEAMQKPAVGLDSAQFSL